jgi:hypothetical protein
VANHYLTLRPVDWCAEASALLERAMACDPLATVETLRRAVAVGEAGLIGVYDGARLVGALVLRVDVRELGREGVIVAAAGRLPGVRLLDLLPHVEGRFRGCRSVRVHTARPGLVRALTRRGYVAREIVMARALA